VPFIARYRKTGSLDEVAIAFIRDRLAQLDGLDKRRVVIAASRPASRLNPSGRATFIPAFTAGMVWGWHCRSGISVSGPDRHCGGANLGSLIWTTGEAFIATGLCLV
jgi:hypothetical protein